MRNHADGTVDWHAVERVLILKVSSMGDVVHASPVAAALKRAYPHLRIGWVAEDRHGGVLVGSPRIDRIHILPHASLRRISTMARVVRQISREIRAERYQVAIDLQGLLKSAMWGVLGGVPMRFGGHRLRELTPLILRRIPIQDRPDRHVVQQYLDALRWLGVPCEFPDLYRTPDDARLPEPPVEFPLAVSSEAEASVRQKLHALGVGDAPLITLNPSAGREWKRWALEQFAELSDRIETELGLPTVFLGGRGDLPLAERLQSLKQCPLRSLIGQTNLEELKALIRCSAVHVCGDTGSAHLAS
ncbi:MAG: glycosyltransferase family 9 protein, partial [Fimbriimonadales bacterium]